MADGPLPREDILQVLSRLDRGAGPGVVGLAEWRRIDPEGVRLERGAVLGQGDGDAPAGPRRQVHGPDDARGAAVGVPAEDVIDGGGRRRGVADDAEVELDAARGPRSAQGDLAELEDLVPVQELAAGGFVDRPPDLAAGLGQDRDLDIGIAQPDDRPGLFDGLGRESVEEEVGIEPGARRSHRRAGEYRDGVGVGKGIGPDGLGLLLDDRRPGGGRPAGGRAEEDERQAQDERGTGGRGFLHGRLLFATLNGYFPVSSR